MSYMTFTWTVGCASALYIAKSRQLSRETELVVRDDLGGRVVQVEHTETGRIGKVNIEHSRAAIASR